MRIGVLLLQRLEQIIRMLEAIQRKLGLIQREEMTMAGELDALRTAVANETTVNQSAVTLLQNLTSIIQAGIDTGDLAEVQKAVDQINGNTQALSDAVTANTPASNTPAPEPTPAPVFSDPAPVTQDPTVTSSASTDQPTST